jgi:hypothetical protein
MNVKPIVAACLAGCATLVVAATAALAQLATVGVNELNVRSGPGTNYDVTYVLRRGDRVEIIRRQGDWAFIVGERGGEGWVYGPYLTTTSNRPPSPPTPPPEMSNDVFQGNGTITNARYSGPGNANVVIVQRDRSASLSLSNAGRFSVEYLGTVRSNFEGSIQLDINRFRSSEMGYRTVPASGTCDVQASAGNVRKVFCTVSGSGIDHGRSNFTAP